MGECAGVDEELDTEKKDGALAEGTRDPHHGVEIAGINENSGDYHVGDFDNDVGDEECLP